MLLRSQQPRFESWPRLAFFLFIALIYENSYVITMYRVAYFTHWNKTNAGKFSFYLHWYGIILVDYSYSFDRFVQKNKPPFIAYPFSIIRWHCTPKKNFFFLNLGPASDNFTSKMREISARNHVKQKRFPISRFEFFVISLSTGRFRFLIFFCYFFIWLPSSVAHTSSQNFVITI